MGPHTDGGAVTTECTKTGYTSKRVAKDARNSANRRRNVRLRIYQCDNCGRWHLTSRVWADGGHPGVAPASIARRRTRNVAVTSLEQLEALAKQKRESKTGGPGDG